MLAVVLAPLVESSLKQSLLMSSGSLAIFFTRPISAVLIALSAIFLLLPFMSRWWRA